MSSSEIENASLSLRRSALYVSFAVGLGTFLALVITLPAPIVGYVAKGVVEQRVVQATDDAAPLLSEAQVREIAGQVFEADRTSGDWPRFGEWTHLDEIVRIQGILSASDRVRFEIYCRDRSADRAEKLCGKIASETVDRQPTSINPRLPELQTQRNDLAARLAVVNDAIRGLDDELARLDRERTASLNSREDSSETARQAVNPALQAMLAELAKLEEERGRLAAVRTDEHPQIIELDTTIAALRTRLSEIQPENADSSALTFGEASPESNGNAQAFAERYAALQEDCRTRLREQHARRDRLEAELARTAVPPRPTEFRTEIVEPVTIVERVGGSPGGTRLAAYVAIAIIMGASVSLLGPRDRKRYAIREAAECVDLLNLKVAGELNAVPARIPAPHWNERSRKFAVSAAEFTIAASLVVLTFHLVRSQRLTVPVANDPFGAVAEAIDRSSEASRLR